MAYVHFDSDYVPCGFLIVRTGAHYKDESNTVLVQLDYDYPGVANSMGWNMGVFEGSIKSPFAATHCQHQGTDGTIPCPNCGMSATDFINAALDFIQANQNKDFPGLDDYFFTD